MSLTRAFSVVNRQFVLVCRLLQPLSQASTLKRFEAAGLVWPLSDSVTDGDLEARLYKNAWTKQGHRRQIEPDWAVIHRELERKHVTLSILCDEYIDQHPSGSRYSRFCDLYRAWECKLSVTMRQAHDVAVQTRPAPHPVLPAAPNLPTTPVAMGRLEN